MRPQVLDSLGLTGPAEAHLQALTGELDAAWRQMADRLATAGDTSAVRVVPVADDRMRLSVERLEALGEPDSLVRLRGSPRRCCPASTCRTC